MRLACALVVIAACGRAATPAQPRVVDRPVPRLRPPPLIDPDARGATYLSAVALQLQPGWGQFLDDCRLRLPARHPLNDLALTATAELVIDGRGGVAEVKLASSGNADFDRAVGDAVRDANPLPAPPRELWSDDDRVHLRWLFARDRRQAGPATATIIDVQLPVVSVVERLVAAHDLTRAARRVLSERGDRTAAMQKLVAAVLREALGSSDSTVRRNAVESIGRARMAELAGDVRALLSSTGDVEQRLAAIAAVVELGDDASAATLLDDLDEDIVENARLAHAEMAALVALHHEADLASWLRARLTNKPSPTLIEGLAYVDLPELRARLAQWQSSRNVRERAAACRAAPTTKGLGDRDASVRASCIEAIRDAAPFRAQLGRLAKDRDVSVRAAAVARVATPSLDDPAPEVRAAYARALAPAHADVRVLLADRDPDVRAAAWTTFARGDESDKVKLAAQAALDPAAQVRAAAVIAMDDDALLDKLATTDEAGDVRTAAAVQLAVRRGRAAITEAMLTRIAEAPAGSSERVRGALAWLLAR
jgi:TonB family protein